MKEFKDLEPVVKIWIILILIIGFAAQIGILYGISLIIKDYYGI